MIKMKHYKLSVLLIPFVIYLLLFFSPLSSKAHDNYFYLFVFLPFVLFSVSSKDEFYHVLKSKIFVLVVLFVSYMALTVVLNISSVPLKEIFKPLRHWFSFLAFLFLSILLFSKYDLEEKMKYVSLWAAIWGGLSILLFYYDKSFTERLCYFGRVEHPIFGACIYTVPFLFLLFSKKNFSILLRVCLLLVLLFSIVISQSRGPIVALSVAVVAGFVVKGKKILPVLIGLSVIIIWVLDYLEIISCGRIFWTHSSFRIPIWEQVISESIKNGAWIFGSGIAANESVTITSGLNFTHAHSGYIGTFFLGGIIGLAILLIVIFFMIQKALTIKSIRNDSLAISLIVFALLSITTDTHKLLNGPHPLWFFFWFPVAYLSAQEIKYVNEQ